MIKVTQKEFYDAIGPRDICVTSKGYDHSHFETRNRVEVGRAYVSLNDYDENGRAIKSYFLTEAFYKEVKNEA